MLVDMVKERGFRDGGYIRVAHCFAEEAAADFRECVLAVVLQLGYPRQVVHSDGGEHEFFAPVLGVEQFFDDVQRLV